MKKFNWQLWAGFLLSVFGFFSYPLLFVKFAVTRDFPWFNLLLLAVAIGLLLFGIRRAFASDRSHPIRSKIVGGVVTAFSLLMVGSFIFTVFIWARIMPASQGAPQVGQQAPAFALTDTNGRQVSLAELLSVPVDGRAGSSAAPPKGVLLIFYRGYW
ncbi:MAG TPA: hypothetical protein VGO68_05885 [Pyrinomonadaceae bacterium]|jgi:hypothetical protein|nr:hypothetical protein [Pyrinomonadaceae bacterium]